jgi:hypothetical protein
VRERETHKKDERHNERQKKEEGCVCSLMVFEKKKETLDEYQDEGAVAKAGVSQPRGETT